MNLVDAIRKAANESGAERTTVVGLFAVPAGPDPDVAAGAAPPAPAAADAAIPAPKPRPVRVPRAPADPASPEDEAPPAPAAGNLVRIELFLGPEQLHAMLRGAFTGHRSVMTLRDAARYLHTSIANIERLAQEGDLPGFRVEGQWRFLKAAIDEWAVTRSGETAPPEESDAA